ncbi:hypothetical protein EV368DRAFT_69396 [Lentinula lateritia]|nr:hypothetical protein EV368DRAFT_69396 [Lentinula lateritia]
MSWFVFLWMENPKDQKELMSIMRHKAEVAGNHQWGLDVGPHEMGWNPQFTGPNVTVGKRREGNDDNEVVKRKEYNHKAEEVEREKAKLTELSHKQQKRKAKDSNMVKAVKKRKKQ